MPRVVPYRPAVAPKPRLRPRPPGTPPPLRPRPPGAPPPLKLLRPKATGIKGGVERAPPRPSGAPSHHQVAPGDYSLQAPPRPSSAPAHLAPGDVDFHASLCAKEKQCAPGRRRDECRLAVQGYLARSPLDLPKYQHAPRTPPKQHAAPRTPPKRHGFMPWVRLVPKAKRSVKRLRGNVGAKQARPWQAAKAKPKHRAKGRRIWAAKAKAKAKHLGRRIWAAKAKAKAKHLAKRSRVSEAEAEPTDWQTDSIDEHGIHNMSYYAPWRGHRVACMRAVSENTGKLIPYEECD